MDEGVLLEASDRVRRNSLVLRLVAEAVEVPQDRLAEVEVVPSTRGARIGQMEARAWKASRSMAESLWVRSM